MNGSGIQPRIVVSLCDLTGEAAHPWAEAGYTCYCVDVQHSIRRERVICDFCGQDRNATPNRCQCNPRAVAAIHYVWGDARSWCPPAGEIVFFMAFPPCTHLAVSGARDFQSKAGYMLADALQIFDSCLMAAVYSGAPYFIENPVGRLSSHRRAPDFYFHPWEYAGYLDDIEAENTSKKTGLWTGGGFVMPEKRPALEPHRQDCWMESPGEDRANVRSATPKGFSLAVFEANCETLTTKD